MRSTVVVILLFIATAAAAFDTPPAPTAQDEFVTAWQEFAEPVRQKRDGRVTLEASQQARLAAIPHMRAAVGGEPSNTSYRAALAYIQLAAGRYADAKKSINNAIDIERSDPLLYLLRGQAEAALAHMDPETAADRIGDALRAFEDAANLDRENSLALLQAASVGFDVGRTEYARRMIDEALKRPRLVLYPLPLPDAFSEDPGASIRMWQYVQLGHWQQLIARCANVERMLLKLGVAGEEAAKPDPDADPAEADAAKLAEVAETYQRALGVARFVGSAEPNLFIAVVSGIDMMEDAYAGLLRVALTTGSNEAQRWDGEMGVLAIGRQYLYAALQRYEKQRDEDPPASIDELLQFEAELLRQTILGIGLRPAEPEPQAETGEKQASPS